MLCRICAKTFAKTPCSGAQNGATSLQKSPKDYRNCSRLDSGDIKYTIVFNKYLQYVEFFYAYASQTDRQHCFPPFIQTFVRLCIRKLVNLIFCKKK